MLWIHGGPEGQDVFSFDPWAHFLTQQGYVVLKPNYRGSSGYGERFRNLNVEDSGGGELDDVVAGAQYSDRRRDWPIPVGWRLAAGRTAGRWWPMR